MSMPLSFALRLVRALAEATRWRIAELILERSLSANDLASILEMPRSTVSSHLRIMCEAGLMFGERHRRCIRYRVEDRHQSFIATLRGQMGISERIEPTLASDSRRAQRLLAQRKT